MEDDPAPYTPFHRTPPSPDPQLDRLRVLGRYLGVTGKLVTAAIYRVATGLELRIDYARDVRDTLLSRTGEQPLLMRAESLRLVLEKQGWLSVTTV
jgi:hypothetical protein